MNNGNKFFVIFLLLVSSLYAATNEYVLDLGNGLSDYMFDTHMTLTTDFTIEDHFGHDIGAGDDICSGSEIIVSPDVDAYWPIGRLDIVAPFPLCTAEYCPGNEMESETRTRHAIDINWIDEDVFDDFVTTFSDGNRLSIDFSNPLTRSRYHALEPFTQQSMGYINASDVIPNRRGYAAVICKGTIEVDLMRGVWPVDSETISMSEYHHGDTVTLTPPGYLGSGDLEVRTSLYDVECFGAVVKHPDNTDFNLGYFRLYYYTENRPNIPDFTAIERLSIELTTGDCSLEETSVDIAASSSVGDGARLIAVDVRNSGDDPIQVTSVSVSPATSIWDVFPLQPSLCSALGFSFCPASGFDETLEHGEETTLYVVLSNRVGSDATLTLNARTATECAPISCTEEVLVRSGSITSCEIDGPPGGLVGQNTITRFGVTCYDGMGTEIACVGDDWSLVSLTGEIMESDNEHAILYVDSRIGSSGRIRYTSGMANCDYRATIIDPLYDCYFDPSVADLDYGESEDFDLICTRGDRASTPDDHVDYSLGDGLTGDLTDESSSGVTYTAPYEDTDGDLHAYVYWDVSEDAYDLGTHTSAYIEVRDAGDVGGAVCEFEPPSVTLDWRESQSFTFTCSIDGEETIPDGVNYTLIGGLLGGLNEAGLDGLTYTAPSVNTSGRLRGYAYWGTVASPTVTGTAFADINVYNFSGYPDDVDDNETEDHPTDYDPPFEGATPACTIGDGPLTIYHGYYGWLSIRCGIDANEDCEFVEWTAEGAEIRESDRESDVDGTSFIVTGIYGSTGRIIADVGEDGTCYLPFEVSERACWEIS